MHTPAPALWRPAAIDRRKPVAAQVWQAIHRAIIRGHLPPQTRLSENDLSEQIGVSRTPVREALIKLSEDGLVDVFPQYGSFVAPIRLDEVYEARFIREALETAVIADAARSPQHGLARALAENLDAQREAQAAGDFEGFIELDEAFHALFAETSGHARVWRVVQNEKYQMDRVRFLSLPHAQDVGRLIDQHHAMAEAVLAGESEAAVAATQYHLREILKAIEELAVSHAEFFAAPEDDAREAPKAGPRRKVESAS